MFINLAIIQLLYIPFPLWLLVKSWSRSHFPSGFSGAGRARTGSCLSGTLWLFFRLVGPWIRQEVGKIVKNFSMSGILKVDDTLNNWSIWQRDFSKLDITSFYCNVHNHPRLGGQQILQGCSQRSIRRVATWVKGIMSHSPHGYVLPTHTVMGWSIVVYPMKKNHCTRHYPHTTMFVDEIS